MSDDSKTSKAIEADKKNEDEENAKKSLEEIKKANELYNQKYKLYMEKKNELNTLQLETFEALQRAALLNDQFNTSINRQLLLERDQLKDEIKKIKSTNDK